MPNPQVNSFFDEATNTISYVVIDPETNACAIIDSLLDFDSASGRTSTESVDRIIAFVKQKEAKVEWIIDTHVHADHLTAAPYVKKQLGGRTAIGAEIRTVQDVFGKIFNAGQTFHTNGSQFDHLFADNEVYKVGNLEAKALHTPGHTPACMSHVIGDALFVGDTLFMPDFGSARCDFPGGDATQLFKSVWRLYNLPSETRMFLCHDYLPEGRTEYIWETTVGEQKKSNIHIREGISEAEFVKMRSDRDVTLDMPKLILPSVQVNMRAGDMPDAEDNGVRYLKIPIDAL